MISSPIVPLPAITAGSATGWMKSPSMPGYPCSSMTRHQVSNGTFTILAPRRSMASSLVFGACSGTMAVQGIPIARAPHATPCAMFPALAVYTPRKSRLGSAERMAFVAPRSLKEPMGWRHSSLRWIRAGASGRSSGTSGVRSTTPWIRSRARAISSGRGGSTARIARPTEIELYAAASLERFLVDVVCRRQVLDRDSQRLEERDLRRRAPSGHAAEKEIAHFAHDVAIVDRALLLRNQEVARLVQRGLAAVHVETRTNHRVGMQLPRIREAGAHGVDVGSGRDPLAPEHGLPRSRGGANEVGPFHRGAGVLLHFDSRHSAIGLALGEGSRVVLVSAPDADAPELPHRPHGFEMGARPDSRARVREIPPVLPPPEPGGGAADGA